EYLTVKKGQVAGVRQVCRATNHGEEKLYLELRMYVGAKDPADTIKIKGQPDLTLTIPGGTHGDLATAAAVVNAILDGGRNELTRARPNCLRWLEAYAI